jgi:rfaE bifunctional protein kinase chain/domain
MIIGDLMIDEYLIGRVSRISPEAPVPVVEINAQTYRLGGAANVALNISSLGCESIMVGAIGDDMAGDTLLELLHERKVSSDGMIRLIDHPTTVKTRIIGDSQHVARVDRENSSYLHSEYESQLTGKINELIDSVDAIIIEDYNKGVLTEGIINFIKKKTAEKNKIITVDPKFKNFLKYQNVTVFKPNIKETEEALALKISNDNDLISAGQALLNRLNSENILITRGSEGMSLFEANGEVTHVPTRARNVADVSGAGDTVISTLTAAMCSGASLREAATIANFAAGIVCEEIGIVPIDANKLYRTCLEQNIFET